MSEVAKPVLTPRKLPHALVWVAPVLMAIFSGYLVWNFYASRGPEITIEFSDSSGLMEGQTRLLYRGAEIGRVTSITLSDDHKHSLVHARLEKREDIFATKGALFWIVRPEVTGTTFKGLDTLLSGSYIHASPGKAEEEATNFEGLGLAPRTHEEGEHFTLLTPRLGHAQEGAAVSYKGIQVGSVQEVELAKDASHVDVRIVVYSRYAHLVRTTSKFWIDSGFDFRGGIFSGLHVQLESLKTVVSGGIAFATPEKDFGPRAQAGSTFNLEEDAKKDWQNWSPRIGISPRTEDSKPDRTPLPTPAREKSNAKP
jgi:paraquat-inducible protein B